MSNRILGGYEKQEYIGDRLPCPVDIVADTAYTQSISGETVQLYYWNGDTLTIDAGQATGTIVIAKLAYSGILDSLGAMIGNAYDTSFSWTTNTVLPKASLQPLLKRNIEDENNKTLKQIAADITNGFTNGQWCLDHRNGVIYGKKAATGVSDIAAYKVLTQTTGGGAGLAVGIPIVIYNGQKTVTTAGTRVALAASQAVQTVTIRALVGNTGLIYIGGSSVASTNGVQLEPGDAITLAIANLATVYIDSAVNGEGVSYIGS